MQAFADADLKELEQDIKPTGFYHNKAKNIIGCAKEICEKYGGEVPGTLEELTALPGVGRKTANVIRGNIYHDPSIVVDTHVKRISRRLGFTEETDPEKVEYDLMRKCCRKTTGFFITYRLLRSEGRSVLPEVRSAKNVFCRNIVQNIRKGSDGMKPKTRKIVTAVIAIVLVLMMVLPLVLQLAM